MAAAAVALDPFEYTATGILGEKRETMLQNQLLLRNELGKPMHRGYGGYPGEVFRYGRPCFIKEGGAAEAMRGWTNNNLSVCQTSTGADGANGRTERDFMALNRAAVVAGLTNAAENYQFRATHDVRRKVQAEQGRKSMSRRLPPTMVFGISTRPSTPVHDLLEHRYQDAWLEERRGAELSKRHSQETKKLAPGKVYETRACQLRAHQVPVEAAPLWQLPRFTQSAKPHLETFRREGDKNAAVTSHQSDGIARRGVFGHGVYEVAKS